MANEPITREEILLNAVATGEAANLEPITREEMFLAKLGGADVKTPTPITRKEQFLQKAIEGGGTGGGDNFPIGDENTHIWISLAEGRTSPMLGVCPNGAVTVDWGDGTDPDVLTGTSTTTVKWTPTHNYASAGDYVITLTVDGTMGLYGAQSNDSGPYLLRYTSSQDSRNVTYRGAIKRIEIGGCVELLSYALFDCVALKAAIVPEDVTNLPTAAFYQSPNLETAVFLGNVLSIGSNCFYGCKMCRCIDFTMCTAVPAVTHISAITGHPADCEIRVPAALYDEWVAATNWSNYAANIVAV